MIRDVAHTLKNTTPNHCQRHSSHALLRGFTYSHEDHKPFSLESKINRSKVVRQCKNPIAGILTILEQTNCILGNSIMSSFAKWVIRPKDNHKFSSTPLRQVTLQSFMLSLYLSRSHHYLIEAFHRRAFESLHLL